MPAREATVAAQAKLNLFLRVLAREDTGYHQIETLFCRIALADTVIVRTADSGASLECSGPFLPARGLGAKETNLAWRAAMEYARATGFPAGFHLSIEKRIPVGGGLGGGSADAGAVLRALNALNPRPVSRHDLLRLAGSLGADVPFLTQDDSTVALAWGRGERMVALPALPASAVWLLVPEASVGTADAYRWMDEAAEGSGPSLIPLARLGSWEGLAAVAGNDFEDVVGQRLPIIARLLTNLRSAEMRSLLGPAALVTMTGSGSCVAVITGAERPAHLRAVPVFSGITMLETETSVFVEPVLTH